MRCLLEYVTLVDGYVDILKLKRIGGIYKISPTAKSGRIEPMNPRCAAWITQTLGTPMEIQ